MKSLREYLRRVQATFLSPIKGVLGTESHLYTLRLPNRIAASKSGGLTVPPLPMGGNKIVRTSRAMLELDIRLLDQVIIGLGFLVLVIIGIRCSRRSQTDEGYFLAGPVHAGLGGWLLADGHHRHLTDLPRSSRFRLRRLQLGATSCPTSPTYRRCWWPSICSFLSTGRPVTARPASIWNSGSACGRGSTRPPPSWSSTSSGPELIGGGLLCLPVIVSQLPGGFAELLRVAEAENKFDLGSTDLTLQGKTVWAYIVAELMILLQITGTDQTNVQRYAAAKSDNDASRGAVICCCLAIPTWTYFVFLGTAL